MRAITIVVLLGIAALASGLRSPPEKAFTTDKDFLLKQKTILEVLHHVYQFEDKSQYYQDAMSWKFEGHWDKFSNVKAVKEFLAIYELDLLDREEVFSIFYEKHRDFAVSLFHVFYYAKDWETFYSTMVWAKYHCNPGMFVYALTVAVLHRPDLQGIVLPAPYEIYPYHFFNTDTMQTAQSYKMQDFHDVKKVDGTFDVVIPYNYTIDYYQTNVDQKISYFTEDIGLNSYYYYFHMDYPFWMEGKEFNLNKDRRGELYLYVHQQLLARYFLERLSHGMGEIPEFSWYNPIETGYIPNLRYYNGLMFPTRANYYAYYYGKNYYDVAEVTNYERRIRDAIDYGFVILPDNTNIDLTKPESINMLGNLIQGNPDWPHTRYYKYVEVYARILLGNTLEYGMEKSAPSVLEHYETAMRDPLFYMLYKRLIKYYYQFKDHLPSYTHEELEFSGVKIEGVEIEKLVTYFEHVDADISHGLEYNYQKVDYFTDFIVKARQYRLNHLPIIMKVKINSEKTTTGTLRIFLGPKYDEFGNVYEISDNRDNWWLLDAFMVDLKSGVNTITYNSEYASWFFKDRTPYPELYKQVMTAYNGGEKFLVDNTHSGFPKRLMLPKGRVNGMPYQLYFIVTPFVVPTNKQYSTYDQGYGCGVGSGSRYIDALPFGYPFDREIDETYWFTPNMYFADTLIFHKKDSEIYHPFY